MDTEIVEIARTDTTVTLKANPSDTSNNNLYVWNTGDIAQEITTDKDQKILCFPCENSRISTEPRSDYYEIYDEPYTPEERWNLCDTRIDYQNTDAITITTARIKINSEGWLIKTHPTVGNDYYETFKLSFGRDDSGNTSGGVYLTYNWYELTSGYYAKSEETVFLPDFDISKYHNYTFIYHKVDTSNTQDHLWDIDFYVDDKRVISQRSVNHIYITTYYWNYLPNCSYKFVRNTVIRGVSSIPEANEYTQLLANITASRNPVTTNVPALSTSELTCHVDGITDRDNDRYKQYIEHDWGEVDFSVFPPRLLYADGDILAPTVDDLGDASGEHITIDGDDCLKVTGLINFPRGYNNPLYKRTPINNIQVEFDYKYEVMSSGSNISANPYASIYTLPYYTGGSYNSKGIHLHYVASVSKYVICIANSYLYKGMSDYLDIDFTKWHRFKIVIVTNPVETNKSIAKIYIDGTYIPFHDNAYGTVVGTDLLAISGYNESGMFNYWHYTFNSHANWHEGQVIYYKNYKIKTITINPNYEEYPELTYLWDTGETTKQITVQPTVPNTYTCTVTQGSRTANASILIDTILRINELPVAIINTDNVITIPRGPVAIIKANGGIYG